MSESLSNFLGALALIGGFIVGVAIVVVLARIVTHRLATGVRLNMTYQEFADRQAKWREDHDRGFIYADEVAPRYCNRCGKPTEVTLVSIGGYNEQTGQRRVRAYLDCPSFGVWPLTLHTKKVLTRMLSQEFAYEMISEAIEKAVVDDLT